MRIVGITILVALVVMGGYIKVRTIQDCGFLGVLKGAELIWAFGGCHRPAN